MFNCFLCRIIDRTAVSLPHRDFQRARVDGEELRRISGNDYRVVHSTDAKETNHQRGGMQGQFARRVVVEHVRFSCGGASDGACLCIDSLSIG